MGTGKKGVNRMTRTSVWALGLGAGVAGYGIWCAWRGTGRLGWSMTPRRRPTLDEMVNEASEDSFPASDAPSHTPITGTMAPVTSQ